MGCPVSDHSEEAVRLERRAAAGMEEGAGPIPQRAVGGVWSVRRSEGRMSGSWVANLGAG